MRLVKNSLVISVNLNPNLFE